MGWLDWILGHQREARAHDIVGRQHVGAWIDKEREEDPVDLPPRLIALTDGELGHVSVSRRDNDQGEYLELGSSKGRWQVPIESEGHLWMIDLAHGINAALAEVGAKGRLYNLQSGEFAYATLDQVQLLAHEGILAEDFFLPAELGGDWPFVAGTEVRFHSNGAVAEATIERPFEIDGVVCQGKVVIERDGELTSATLAEGQTFLGYRFPAGSDATFWSTKQPCAICLSKSMMVEGMELPAGSTLHFAEEGKLIYAEVGGDVLVGGGRAEQGDIIDFDGTEWKEASDWPLWRADLNPNDTIDDPDVAGIDDLRRLYPLPDGFAYERDGDRMVVRRAADQALFSIMAECGRLIFQEKRFDKGWGSHVYHTMEVMKASTHPKQ